LRVERIESRHRGSGCVSPSWRYEIVSVADFDRALDRNPEVVRPYMHAIGDHRRGQELLDSAQDDKTCQTLTNLKESPEGRQLLDKFASLMDESVGVTLRASLRDAT